MRRKTPLTLSRGRGRRTERSSRRGTVTALLALLSAALPSPIAAAGWDRVDWGMTSNDIAAIYGARAQRLGSPIVFGDSYSDIVLRNQPFGQQTVNAPPTTGNCA